GWPAAAGLRGAAWRVDLRLSRRHASRPDSNLCPGFEPLRLRNRRLYSAGVKRPGKGGSGPRALLLWIPMAWTVVIVGGGFAGASVARELERLLPRQSARLILVNDVNFLLYTPFLPEAAAGTLEPRHVVTPLREILDRTYLRLGSVSGH